MSKTFALCLLLAVCCGTLAEAATLKVPAEHASIGAAVAAANPGDIIAISKNPDTSDGSYRENVVVPAGKNLTITGKVIWDGTATPGNPGICLDITGPNAGPFLVQGIIFRNGTHGVRANNLGSVDDLTVTGCQGQFLDSELVEVDGDNFVATKNILLGCSSCITIVGDNATVSGNKFNLCSDDGVNISNAAGTLGATIEKNLFYVHDNGDMIRIDCDRATIASNQCKVCSAAFVVTAGDSVLATGNSFAHVNGGISITERAAGGNRAIKNKFATTRGAALTVKGPSAEVSANSVNGCTGRAISTDDTSPKVIGNKVKFADAGIYCSAATGALVDKNSIVTLLNGDGIAVAGDNIIVTNNSVADISGGNGFSLSDTATGGATADKNKVKNVTDNGIYCDCDGSSSPVVISNCSVAFGGNDDDYGFSVAGNGIKMTQCKVTGFDGDGFNFSGSGCKVTDCTASQCGIDGFDCENDGNTFTNCKATGNGGEGFDNSLSGGTEVDGGSFTKNRIDFAGNNTVTFITPPKIGDGTGITTVPEVD